MPTVYENRRPAAAIGSERPRRNRQHLDRLTRDAIAAEQAGMSYGNWKAMHPHTPEDEPKPVKTSPKIRELVCGYCGGQFVVTKQQANRKYCCDECRDRANNRNARQRYRNERPKVEDVPCGYCGKVFQSVRGKKYCCKACYSAGARRDAIERARKRKEEAQKND